MAEMRQLCDDLAAEHRALDDLVAGLDEAGWDAPTPAEGWAVRDQISHLAFFDEAGTLSASDPEAFQRRTEEAMKDLQAFVDSPTAKGRSMSGAELLAWWREARTRMLEVFAELDPKARLPWYGPAMSAASFATARLMETWAHGQDVFDGLGVDRPATDRLRHVAHIGVRALPNSYRANGLAVPETPVRVELTAPSGETWTWGDEGVENVVRGPALDFCLIVTQRRHPDDTAIETEGPVAKEWMSIAQAFAGPPGSGREPGAHTRPGASR